MRKPASPAVADQNIIKSKKAKVEEESTEKEEEEDNNNNSGILFGLSSKQNLSQDI